MRSDRRRGGGSGAGACGLVTGEPGTCPAGGDESKGGLGSAGAVVVSGGDEGRGCGLVGVDSGKGAAGEEEKTGSTSEGKGGAGKAEGTESDGEGKMW